MTHPYYKYDKYDSNSGDYILLEKPPRATLVMLREVELPYRDMDTKEVTGTYTTIMDTTEDLGEGKILREFAAWVFK